MIQTQLIIYDNASGIVKYEIDLYEDVPLELTKQISDISDPQSRNADYTKTIKVPATANNNKIFNYIFDLARFTRNDSGINFNTDFSPIYKANAMLYKNSVLQSVGYIQLTNIVKLPNNSYEYEINFIGRVKNIITDIENKYLSDIDLSEFDHTLHTHSHPHHPPFRAFSKQKPTAAQSATVGQSQYHHHPTQHQQHATPPTHAHPPPLHHPPHESTHSHRPSAQSHTNQSDSYPSTQTYPPPPSSSTTPSSRTPQHADASASQHQS